ncbi:MAG: VWA domain-containing protein [Firmicutes bacterium]|nr:VWA domain-containing protein [Bacillota bacterium]
MHKSLTEVIFILDRSGSMGGLESDTIGGYNGFLEKQKKLTGDTHITTVLFDDQYEILYNGVDVSRARLTPEQYFVRGMTALYDAVGKTILDVGTRLARIPEAERPGKVIMIITTDGAENSSREFSGKRVKEMIAHQRDKYGWEFLFFGANIDTATVAANIGIDTDNAIAFKASSAGILDLMECVSEKVEHSRKGNK